MCKTLGSLPIAALERWTDTRTQDQKLHCGFYQQPVLTLKAGSWRKKRANYITLTQAVPLFFLGVSKKRRLSFLWRCSWSQSVVKGNWLVRPNWPGRDTHEPKLSKNCERKESSAFWSKEHLNSGRSLGYVSLARQTSEPHALLLPLLKRSEHQARSGGERKGCLHSMGKLSSHHTSNMRPPQKVASSLSRLQGASLLPLAYSSHQV